MAAPTAIIYNGKRLIPAPRLQFSRNHKRSADQSIIGAEQQVTLTGQLVGCKGWDFTGATPDFYTGSDYPADDPNTTCNKFTNLVDMQEALRGLFSVTGDYFWLEVVGCDGLIQKWRARTLSVDFGEGPWTDVAPYTIVLGLQTEVDYDDLITDIATADVHIDHNETWDVQWDEENGGIYTLSHTLSCQSEEVAEDENTLHDGWVQAKAWVDDRLAGASYVGAAPNIVKNTLVTDGLDVDLGGIYGAYNYTVQRSIDEYGGNYSVTESWTLAKDEVFSTWTITNNKPRDDYNVISVDGEFRAHLGRTVDVDAVSTNPTAAIDAFDLWETGGGPFAAASSVYAGCGALANCAVSRSVTTVVENNGSAYGEATRSVKFTFEFSDAEPTAEVSLTKTVDETLSENCETRVTISMQIQGHECDCVTSKLENAQAAYAAINCSTEANAIYTGGGTLTQVRSTYTENERAGTVEASCEFTDKFESGVITEERISMAWNCGDLTSDGTEKTSYSVEGSIKALCSDTMPTAPSTSAYNCYGDSCCTLRRTNVTRDATNKSLTYSYEYDNDCGPGLVDITIDTTNGPDNCDYYTTSVGLSVQGFGCDSVTMLANAQTALSSVDADSYAPVGACRTSFRENKNVTRGSIQQTYTYTTECDASVDVTITTAFDAGRCDDSSHSVQGEIKGNCYVVGGAMAAAEALYLSHLPANYADGSCLKSSRVSRNDKKGSISFGYEFTTCPDGYEHEQSVTNKTDNFDCCTEVSISGNIVPYCDDSGEAGQIVTGEAAWATIGATLAAEAASYCSSTPVLRSSSVSRNKRNGQIQYSYTYACCNNSIAGVLKESVNITREFPSDVVAIIPILGRTCGPIVQDKGTKSVERCNIAIALTYPKDCSTYAKPSGLEAVVQGIISAAGCCTGAYGSYQERDTESWNPRTGQYTRNVTFVCECC